MFDLAVNLRHGFLAAHSEDRMAKTDENSDKADCWETRVLQPSKRATVFTLVVSNRVSAGKWRQVSTAEKHGIAAPDDHDYNHDGRDLHDAHGLFAGLMNTLNVFPPEINRAENREYRRGCVVRQVNAEMHILEELVQQAGKVESC